MVRIRIPTALATAALLVLPAAVGAQEMSEEEVRAHLATIAAACPRPEAPALPDGATAEEATMASAGRDVRAFVDAANGFLTCLQEHEAGYGDELEAGMEAVIVAVYNDTVEQMEALADAYNDEVRAWKAARGET
jgi:hypothetical protein